MEGPRVAEPMHKAATVAHPVPAQFASLGPTVMLHTPRGASWPLT